MRMMCLYFSFQVLSETVSKALPLVVGKAATETARFVDIFDKFFDILNGNNFTAGARHRKRFSHPYCSYDDERLKVCLASSSDDERLKVCLLMSGRRFVCLTNCRFHCICMYIVNL